ncbi:MAG: hypothetical protein M0Q01_03910 [Syntrophales bacterium]|jgi:hypothetical protein|nr:hypothetical protein [Syntrophales bacterium]
MTIKIPEENLLDRLLSSMGKKRAIHIPLEIYEKYGPYVYAQAKKESFWHALFRSKNLNPPVGWIDPLKIIFWEHRSDGRQKRIL